MYSTFLIFTPGESRGESFKFSADRDLLFSDILGGSSVLYAGSTITIREQLDITTVVNDDTLVDVDYNWVNPRYYMGTCQILDYTTDPIWRAIEDEFFLISPYQRVIRDSYYTVVASPSKPIVDGGSINIEDCNFALQPTIVFDPLQTVPINGALGLHSFGSGASPLIGKYSVSPPPILDDVFAQRLPGVAVFLRPGVGGVSVYYSVSAVGQIVNDAGAFAPSICHTTIPDCDSQFSAFIESHNQSTVSISSNYYTSLSSCQAVPGGGCRSATYICPTDATKIYTYYYHANH